MNPAVTIALTAAAVLIVAWFAVGTIWNVRRGGALMRWMQQGLRTLGDRTTVRWLGSTAVEMVIREAKAPFQKATLVLFLEPRDLPWMWAVSRSRGRRDTIIFRAELRSPPRADLEAIDRSSWSGRDALRSLPAGEWSARQTPGGLAAYHRDGADPGSADRLIDLAGRGGLAVQRLSVRRTAPHLQLHVLAPDNGASASALFEAVRALGESAAR